MASSFRKDGEQMLWIADDAVARVESGRVTLQIDKPTRCLPRSQAWHVADKIWFADQMNELQVAKQRGDTKVIPLTDRRRRSSLRLGGGFMITQGHQLVVVRRSLDAPRPGQFCECGGLFEVMNTEAKHGEPDVHNDYIASLLKESLEIVLVRDETLYIPQLAPWPPTQIGFQPPGTLSAYNNIMEEELGREARKAVIPYDNDTHKPLKFWMQILDYDQAVRLEFGFSPPVAVEVTAEIDSSSLECVGVLSLPENIDAAVVAFLEEKIPSLEKQLETETDSKKQTKLKKQIAECNKKLKRAREDAHNAEEKTRKGDDQEWAAPHGIEYWDCEMGWDNVLKEEGHPLDRDIHLIDIQTGEVRVWYQVPQERNWKREKNKLGKVKENEFGDVKWLPPPDRKRKFRSSTLWRELSSTKLGPSGSGGRLATEKLQKAMKMYCPLPYLQPLISL